MSAEEYVGFEAYVRDEFGLVHEKLDDIKAEMKRHSAAIEALAAAQPPKVRRAVRDAQAAVSVPMAARDA